MKIWIDLANSPHPLLFAPVVRRLNSNGHTVVMTARDNANTVELARQRWPEVEVVGGDSPPGRLAKLRSIQHRANELRRWAKKVHPAVALSHNSYAQIVAAKASRIPAVTTMDFEHQPANHLAFRLADTVVLPEVVPTRIVRQQGAAAHKTVRYPGLKEELYIGDFEPDQAVLAQVGLSDRPRTLAVMRTPPSRALYHPRDNPLFNDALRTICGCPDTVCVVLTRHSEQIAPLEALGLRNCVIPRAAVDARALMYAADVMVGAGGTMTREASLIGIPTWSMFAGQPPAVDRWLEREGKLSRLTDPEELSQLGPRSHEPRSPEELRRRAAVIEHVLVEATLRAGEQGHRNR
jgi:predicted glycosyltransferase